MRRPLINAFTTLALLLAAGDAYAAQPRIDLAGDGALRPFELNDSDPVNLPFAAATPGPVHVDIISRGAVTVTLVRSNGKRAQQSGAGAFSLDDQVTAEDVAQGQIWNISVRAAKSGGKISGTVAVRHPVGESGPVTEQLARISQRAKPARPPAPAPAEGADTALITQRAQMAQDIAKRHLAEINRVHDDLPPEAVPLLTSRANLLGQGRTFDEINAQAPIPANGVAAGTSKTTLAAGRLAPNFSSTASQSAQGTAASAPPAGTPGTPPPGFHAPAPVLQLLSANQGDPGTTVIIHGQNFGAFFSDQARAYGTVHFVVANGIDQVGIVASWSDTKIVVEVPLYTGIPEYAGQLYVKTTDEQTSAPTAFRFIPRMDIATLYMPPITQNGPNDYAFADSTLSDDLPVGFLDEPRPDLRSPNAEVHRWSGFFGNAANDTFYNTRQLQNGWKVRSCDTAMSNGAPGIQTSDPDHAYANITECRVGTSSPFVKMHWWMEGDYGINPQLLGYGFTVTIIGPKGMPY